MNDKTKTPRTDEAATYGPADSYLEGNQIVYASVARKLEQELTSAQQENARLRDILGIIQRASSAAWKNCDEQYSIDELKTICELAGVALSSEPGESWAPCIPKEEIEQALAAMVNSFLKWPLPESVSADGCATRSGYPNRVGTNLLTCGETVTMINEVVRPHIEELLKQSLLFSASVPWEVVQEYIDAQIHLDNTSTGTEDYYHAEVRMDKADYKLQSYAPRKAGGQ